MCGCGIVINPQYRYARGHQPQALHKPPVSSETRKKMSDARKGKKFTIEHRLHISRSRRKSDATLQQRHDLIRRWACYKEWRKEVFREG